jgi:hypothetical protein
MVGRKAVVMAPSVVVAWVQLQQASTPVPRKHRLLAKKELTKYLIAEASIKSKATSNQTKSKGLVLSGPTS